jgi:hypothetical protein
MPIPILKTPSESKTNSFGLWLMKGMQISMNSCESINFKTQNQDVFWNRYLSWFYVQQNLIKLLFKKSHLQTQSRIVDQYRKFGTTGYRRRK